VIGNLKFLGHISSGVLSMTISLPLCLHLQFPRTESRVPWSLGHAAKTFHTNTGVVAVPSLHSLLPKETLLGVLAQFFAE